MPVYTYRCQNCGVQFDESQKFVDPPMVKCPECGKKTLRKVFNQLGSCSKAPVFIPPIIDHPVVCLMQPLPKLIKLNARKVHVGEKQQLRYGSTKSETSTKSNIHTTQTEKKESAPSTK